MDPRPSTSRYILTALAIILVITTFILVGLNAMNLEKGMRFGSPSQSALDAKYEEGYLAARQEFSSLCPIITQGVLSFTGTVTAISGATLTVTAEPGTTAMALNAEGLGDSRRVLLTDATVIQRLTEKSSETFAKEMAVFNPGDTSAPPTLFTIQKLSATDLAVGMTVTISTESDASKTAEVNATAVSVR